MKIIIEENKTRIRLTSDVIQTISKGDIFSFNKDTSNDFLNINVNISLSNDLKITRESTDLNIAIDQKTIDFISLKENKKEGLFLKDHNITLQIELSKKK